MTDPEVRTALGLGDQKWTPRDGLLWCFTGFRETSVGQILATEDPRVKPPSRIFYMNILPEVTGEAVRRVAREILEEYRLVVIDL